MRLQEQIDKLKDGEMVVINNSTYVTSQRDLNPEQITMQNPAIADDATKKLLGMLRDQKDREETTLDKSFSNDPQIIAILGFMALAMLG